MASFLLREAEGEEGEDHGDDGEGDGAGARLQLRARCAKLHGSHRAEGQLPREYVACETVLRSFANAIVCERVLRVVVPVMFYFRGVVSCARACARTAGWPRVRPTRARAVPSPSRGTLAACRRHSGWPSRPAPRPSRGSRAT